ncbi:MAG: hypothetical protein AVDCRST_MAG13-1617, partial [uncultured Solirubrobacteraceae bacterium]
GAAHLLRPVLRDGRGRRGGPGRAARRRAPRPPRRRPRRTLARPSGHARLRRGGAHRVLLARPRPARAAGAPVAGARRTRPRLGRAGRCGSVRPCPAGATPL